LRPGPVLLSWSTGLATLALQACFTDHEQMAQDAMALFPFLQDSAAQHVALFVLMGAIALGSSFFMMPVTFPVLQSTTDDERSTSVKVPSYSPNVVQHPMGAIDYSYVALNTLCLPGLFYHFICLMRTWGLDFAAPPMFGIYPESPVQLVTETIPHSLPALALYFITYEFVYYWWHRAMHEQPALYNWIHRHHHQQKYPDRAALDTLNTGCVESQIGLYLQLTILVACDRVLGVADLPAAIWFFTIAGYLSVLEHDEWQRKLPFDLFRTDEHHMHHAAVRCNYAPYTALWDRVFGTHRAFEAKHAPKPAEVSTPTTSVCVKLAADIDLPASKQDKPRAVGVTMCLGDENTVDEKGVPASTTNANRAARMDPASAAMDIFALIFRQGRREEARSLEREFQQLVSAQSRSLEREFNQLLSDRIWAKHKQMGGTTHGMRHPSAEETDADVDEPIPGEAQVVTRGVAYSIAGSINALVLMAVLAASFHFERPAV